MKFFSRNTVNRNTASFMLGIWLFVLAAGIANACLLEAPDHGHLSSESSYIIGHTATIEHENEHGSKAHCWKACDEGTHALQSNNGIDAIDPGSAPLTGVIWTWPTPLSARYCSAFKSPPSLSDPPERILYSRWAL